MKKITVTVLVPEQFDAVQTLRLMNATTDAARRAIYEMSNGGALLRHGGGDWRSAVDARLDLRAYVDVVEEDV
jgi:hypothetical protein